MRERYEVQEGCIGVREEWEVDGRVESDGELGSTIRAAWAVELVISQYCLALLESQARRCLFRTFGGM